MPDLTRHSQSRHVRLRLGKGMEGFHIGRLENKMGIRSAQVSEMVLENVRVSADRMIAKPGEGFKLAMKTLDGGRNRRRRSGFGPGRRGL